MDIVNFSKSQNLAVNNIQQEFDDGMHQIYNTLSDEISQSQRAKAESFAIIDHMIAEFASSTKQSISGLHERESNFNSAMEVFREQINEHFSGRDAALAALAGVLPSTASPATASQTVGSAPFAPREPADHDFLSKL
jgi:hypothetical protein